MTRISLKEAYDNRDVIAWLVKHQDEIDEMMNILKNINPDGDLTNIVLKTGDQTIDGTKTFIGKIVADCDIIQNGAAYETHAEQIFSQNDYLVMRDGQLSGLAAGSYSGLQVKKYNGSDDCRMVVDNTGVMRVGDINDERPLLVRDEAADLSSGDVLLWDSVNQKAIGQAKDSAPTAGSTACVTSDGIKTALDGKVDHVDTVEEKALFGTAAGYAVVTQKNGICTISFKLGANVTTIGTDVSVLNGCPYPDSNMVAAPIIKEDGTVIGKCYIYTGYNNDLRITNSATANNVAMTLTYAIKE